MKRLSLLVVVLGAVASGEFSSTAQQTNVLPDGSKYIGEMENGKPNGQGTLIETNGAIYVGGFKDGKKDGIGTMTFPNGSKYVGTYKDDKPQGGRVFGGIGLMIGAPMPTQPENLPSLAGGASVLFVADGSPACKAGIKVGDIITQVDSESLRGRTLSEITDLVRGPVGSKVTLTILRTGRVEPLKIELEREEIHHPDDMSLPKCKEGG